MGIIFNPIEGTFDFTGASGSTYFTPPVSNEGDLPATGADGELKVVRSTDHIYIWDADSSQWIDTGITSSAVIGIAPNAAGFSILPESIGNIQYTRLVLEPATESFPGVVSIDAQTFGGDKTFTGNVILPSLSASAPLKLDGANNIIAADIDLVNDVIGILPVINGGTGSAGPLSNDRLMISDTGIITEHVAITANRALISDSFGLPQPSVVTTTELAYVSGVTSSIQTQINSKVSKAGDIMSGTLDMSGNIISNVGAPSASGDAANKQYVDNLIAGLKWKINVRAASTGNLTLSGTQTVDGVALIAGDRVLVKDQTTASENGIYIVAAGAWTRTTDADSAVELISAAVFVSQGTTNADIAFTQTVDTITLGVTSLTFVPFSTTALSGHDMISLIGGQISADLATDAGLESSNPGNAAGQLRVKLDGATLTRAAAGLKVSTAGITNNEVATGIDAVKIADGSVTNAEFQFINTVTSNVQNQINAKFTLPALTAGSVLFSDGTTIAQDNANFFWDDTNNRLGLGLTTPQSRLHVDGGTGNTSFINITNGATTGTGVGDGFSIGISATGVAQLRQRENLGFSFFTNNSQVLTMTATGSVGIQNNGGTQLATNATGGFLYIPSSAGTPIGTPIALNGTVPIEVDTTNNKFYFYSTGAWHSTASSIGTLGAGNINGADITNGVLTLHAATATTPGIVTIAAQTFAGNKTFTGSIKSETSLILEDPGAGTNTVTIASPTGLAASYSIILPPNDGDSGQVLRTDGAGITSWATIGSSGDLNEGSFSAANNQIAPANVTGFAFANGTVRSFDALVSIYINASTSLYEVYKIYGIQKGADWAITSVATGDDSGVVFSITTAGQIQYTSTNVAGFISDTIKFRAITTTV